VRYKNPSSKTAKAACGGRPPSLGDPVLDISGRQWLGLDQAELDKTRHEPMINIGGFAEKPQKIALQTMAAEPNNASPISSP
jgi:hypothetical protein